MAWIGRHTLTSAHGASGYSDIPCEIRISAVMACSPEIALGHTLHYN